MWNVTQSFGSTWTKPHSHYIECALSWDPSLESTWPHFVRHVNKYIPNIWPMSDENTKRKSAQVRVSRTTSPESPESTSAAAPSSEEHSALEIHHFHFVVVSQVCRCLQKWVTLFLSLRFYSQTGYRERSRQNKRGSGSESPYARPYIRNVHRSSSSINPSGIPPPSYSFFAHTAYCKLRPDAGFHRKAACSGCSVKRSHD